MAGEKDSKKKDDAPAAAAFAKAAEAVKDDAPAAEAPKGDVPAAAAALAASTTLLSFDRWFATLNRPDHHKAGMKAFANTSGKKTLAQWAAIFKAY